MGHLARYAWGLLVLAVLALIAVLLSWYQLPTTREVQEDQFAVAPTGFPPEAPAPRSEDQVDMQQGFDALVSFTGKAFEPSKLTLSRGKRIRFTNNSEAGMALVDARGAALGNGPTGPHDYIEVAFPDAGLWPVSDKTSGATATITVQ